MQKRMKLHKKREREIKQVAACKKIGMFYKQHVPSYNSEQELYLARWEAKEKNNFL